VSTVSSWIRLSFARGPITARTSVFTARSRYFPAFLLASLLALLTGIAAAFVQAAAVAAPLQQVDIGTDPCDNCVFDQEVLMTKDCAEEPGLPHETVTVKLVSADPNTDFVVNVCLYDFSGQKIVCHDPMIMKGDFPEYLFVIDAPDNVAVWMAQSYICEGFGTVRFLEQNCICNCSQEPQPCSSPHCLNEDYVEFNAPCPGPPYQGTPTGKHYGKVRITNPCPAPVRVRYQWQYTQGGVMRSVSSAVYVPASDSVRLCFANLNTVAGDGINNFIAYQYPDCPGTYDPPPGGGGCVVLMNLVRDACCNVNGQNCVERVPVDPLPCVP